MAVLVASGICVVPGTEAFQQGAYGCYNDADFTVSIATAHATLARIDIIVFKVEDSQYSGGVNTSSIVAVTGTPSGSPAVPTAPANSITLAHVAVGAAVSSIVNANITDTRVWLTSLTGSTMPEEQAFTASGTWTKPLGALYCFVEVQASGGGGGGGGATGAGEWSFGDGGGGGEYASGWFLATVLAATVTVTIPAGGAGGVGAVAGTTAGNASFGAHITAIGGGGGAVRPASSTLRISQNQTTRAGGSGGTGGTIRIPGCPGTAGLAVDSGVAGLLGGDGGPSHMSGSSITLGNQNGLVGKNYGGGGGAVTNSASQTAKNGGAGANGLVRVTTYF
jgi:hypothetical protein